MKVKALQCSGINNLELVEFDKPEPQENASVLKIKTCGICGTDLHGIEGKRPVKFPFIPGHEIVATVDSAGKDANKFIRTIGGNDFKPGDRVTINPRIVCGKCYYCTNFPEYQEMCINAITATSQGSGKYPFLFGGWAQYLYVLPGSEIIRLPETLSDELAALIEPFAVAVGCIDRFRKIQDRVSGDAFEIRDTVVVYGIGAIGLFMVAGFFLAGAKKIIAIDTRKEKLELSKEFGATEIIDASSTCQEERLKIIKELTENTGAGVVIESCGVPDVINEGLIALRRGGILFEIGHLLNVGKAGIDPMILCRNELKLLGHYAYPSSQIMLYAACILKRHQLPYEKLLRFIKLEDYSKLFRNLSENLNVIKPAFVM
ncbi:MAG: zinc-binding dehydrogenase [Actinobacteria bacterium]|nr:zinc-binding dehydrogenase [Actinomycetota bacterium]